MCASMVMVPGSISAAAGLFSKAGVSFTGGLLAFVGTSGTGTPLCYSYRS